MIRLSQVTKTFNAGRANQFTAVDDVTIEIGSHRLTVIKGPSGSGKTTLLSLIGCMIRPTSGRILLQDIPIPFSAAGESDSVDISSLPERFLTEIRRSTFGFIFQQFNMIKGISVLENVLLPAYPTGESYASMHDRGMDLLETFGMKRHASSRVELLSGGELQRVAIARALIGNPSILVADEPTAHLDSRLSFEFMETVAALKSAGKTVIIASHDPIIHDSPLADAVIEMRDGKPTGLGTGTAA